MDGSGPRASFLNFSLIYGPTIVKLTVVKITSADLYLLLVFNQLLIATHLL